MTWMSREMKAVDGVLVASRVGDPENFDFYATDESRAWTMAVGDGGLVEKLQVLDDDRLLVICSNSTWMLVGDSETTCHIVKLGVQS